MALTFEEARASVLQRVSVRMTTEAVAIADADGRILAEEVTADRDYPPFARSARDGFAVRAAEVPGELRVVGEVRAGEAFGGTVGSGEAIEIMTGAPVPEGADAVVMVEHTERDIPPDNGRVRVRRPIQAGDNFNERGTEARAGSVMLAAGRRIGYAEVAVLATVGRTEIQVYRQPRVAILATGDEIVEVGDHPSAVQIRNSNALALSVQVRRAGGVPVILPIARDNVEATRNLIEQGLAFDLLLITGGVSVGKYDLVEAVLAEMGAEFFFDRVLIQPGQPVVFGAAPRGETRTFFFGLPGNPASAMVTFELFARAAIEKLQGSADSVLPLTRARLTRDLRHKTGLTRFLPARLSADGATVEPARWQGSGDVAALARANAFLVTEADREAWAAGDDIRVLLK